MIPNMLAEVERCQADYPQAWTDAHTGNPRSEDFIKLLAIRCHAINVKCGLNGKRGNPSDLSDDALNFLCAASESTGRTPEGLPCVVIDVIGAAGSTGAYPTWQVFSVAPEANGAWVQPGPVVAPPIPPQPPALPPYPGDVVFDAIGVALFGDYAQAAGQSPNTGMSRWFGRTTYDYLAGMSMADSIKKHRAEWRAVLGLPPL